MPEPRPPAFCVTCVYYHTKDKGEPKHVCVFPRHGGWDYVLNKEYEDEIDCYRVNTGGNCPLWVEVVPDAND